jgi:hypothetical protein
MSEERQMDDSKDAEKTDAGKRNFQPEASRAGEREAGEFQSGKLPSGEFQPEKFQSEESQSEELQSGEFRSEKFQPGEIPSEEFSSGEFQPEEISSGEIPPETPLAGESGTNAPQGADFDTEVPSGALKCYFYTPRHGDVRGAFCMLFTNTGDILDNLFWVTRSMSGADIDVMAGWRSVNKNILDMGAYEKALSEKLCAVMFDIFTPSVRAALLESAEAAEQLESLANDLRSSFERSVHYFMEISIRLERLSHQSLLDAGVLPPEEGTEEKSPSETGENIFSGTVITCLPVIDPVWGKPVSELVPGDMVNVTIQDEPGVAELIQNHLDSTDQQTVFPVIAIERKENDKTCVLLHISEEIRGLITLTKDLRLNVLNPIEEKKPSFAINVDNVIFFGTFSIAVVVILLVIKFLFF